MNYSEIVDPSNNNKYSIFSKQGKHLLRKYIKAYKSGGSWGPPYPSSGMGPIEAYWLEKFGFPVVPGPLDRIGVKAVEMERTLRESTTNDETTYIITDDDIKWTQKQLENAPRYGRSLRETIIAGVIPDFAARQRAILRQREALDIGGGGGGE